VAQSKLTRHAITAITQRAGTRYASLLFSLVRCPFLPCQQILVPAALVSSLAFLSASIIR
jgi:hypothetical protein